MHSRKMHNKHNNKKKRKESDVVYGTQGAFVGDFELWPVKQGDLAQVFDLIS